MSTRWLLGVLVFGVLTATAAADKPRTWGMTSALRASDHGRVSGACTARDETAPSIDARLTLWNEQGQMVTVPLTLRVQKVKARPGRFVFDAAFDPADHLPGTGLLSGYLELASSDCEDVTGSTVIEDVSCCARHAVPLVRNTRD